MKNKKVLILIMLIVLVIIIFGIYLFQKNSNNIGKEKYHLVESYISQTYGIDCDIIKSSYTHNEEGFTGGLYMYSFECKDKDGKKYIVTYSAYKDLAEETLSNLKIQE